MTIDNVRTIKLALYVAIVVFLLSLVMGLIGIGTTSVFSSVNLASGITANTGKVLLGYIPFDVTKIAINFFYILIASIVICYLGAFLYDRVPILRNWIGNKLHHVVWAKLFYGTAALWIIMGFIDGWKPFTWTLLLTLGIYYLIVAWLISTRLVGVYNFDLEK